MEQDDLVGRRLAARPFTMLIAVKRVRFRLSRKRKLESNDGSLLDPLRSARVLKPPTNALTVRMYGPSSRRHGVAFDFNQPNSRKSCLDRVVVSHERSSEYASGALTPRQAWGASAPRTQSGVTSSIGKPPLGCLEARGTNQVGASRRRDGVHRRRRWWIGG